MRKITIKFLFFDDKACYRCKTTKDLLDEAVKDFRKTHRDVKIEVQKQKLSEEEIVKSPTILLDGKDLEFYLSYDLKQQSDHCEDCSCLSGKSVSCRTYKNGKNLSKEEILMGLEKHMANSTSID